MSNTDTLSRPAPYTCDDPVCGPDLPCEPCVRRWLVDHRPEEVARFDWSANPTRPVGTVNTDAPARTEGSGGTGRRTTTDEVRWAKFDGAWALVAHRELTEGATVTVHKKDGTTVEAVVGKRLGAAGDRCYFEGRRPEQAARPEAADTALDLRPLFDGLVTDTGNPITTIRVAVPGGDTRLKLQIDAPADGKWAGWVFVKDAAEYGRGQKYGSQRPDGTYRGQVEDALRAILADRTGAFAAYGALVGSCGVCNRHLEDDASVERGIGPVCARRLGIL